MKILLCVLLPNTKVLHSQWIHYSRDMSIFSCNFFLSSSD